MTNLTQRILMFVIFIPLILVLVLVFTEPHHLALQIVIIVLGFGLGIETAAFYGLRIEGSPAEIGRRILAIFLCSTVPLIVRCLVVFGLLPGGAWLFSFIASLGVVIFLQIIMTQWLEPEEFIKRIQAYFMILLYPALGLSFIIALLDLENRAALVTIYLSSVFLNDTGAYLAGRLFGKNSPRPLKVSPNKTLVGFISGFLISLAVLVLGFFVRPDLFGFSFVRALVLGILMGIGTIVGDLFESALKRGFGVKDSGAIILGRGGLLDSLDSILFTAPLFYYGYTLFGQLN